MRIDRTMVTVLVNDPLLWDRVGQLLSIECFGEITGLILGAQASTPGPIPHAKHAIQSLRIVPVLRESGAYTNLDRSPVSAIRSYKPHRSKPPTSARLYRKTNSSGG
jgi:hypothetical protein